MCRNCAARCVLEAGNTCTYPKLRLTADPEDNQENCQCMSLNVEHPSKHVNRIIFPSGFWQAAVTGDWLVSLRSYGSHGVHCFSCSVSSKPELLSHSVEKFQWIFASPSMLPLSLPEKNVHLFFPKNIIFLRTQYYFPTQAGIRNLYFLFTK